MGGRQAGWIGPEHRASNDLPFFPHSRRSVMISDEMMNAPPIRTVIFDCDGTLVDSETITNDVLVEFAVEFGLVLDPAETLSRFAGREMAKIVADLGTRLGRKLPDDFTDRFRARQAVALEERLLPIDGADELLRSVGVPVSLASNAPRAKIEINLRVTGLHRYFPADRVFSAYDINVWKPQPDLFLHVAQRTGFEPQHCAVVEDSPAGVEAALRAGMQVFCYARHGDFQLSGDMVGLTSRVQVVSSLSQLRSQLVSN